MNPMWHLLVLGLAVNADNFAVGAAYGVRKIAIPPATNAAIACMAFAFSAVSAWAGMLAGHYLPASTANGIGAALIIGIGLWMMAPAKKTKPAKPPAPSAAPPSVLGVLHEPELADSDHSGAISLSESLVLGVALSLNCLGNGLCAGLLNLGAVRSALVNAVLSYATIWLGLHCGKQFGSRLGNKADTFAGLLMLALGAYQWVNR